MLLLSGFQIFELIEGNESRMKYRKGKDNKRQIKIRKKQKTTTSNNNRQKKKVAKKESDSVIKNSICDLIRNGELYRVSLEILLHDFCTFGIFYISVV